MTETATASALPTWEGFLGPVLVALTDGEHHAARDIGDDTADIAGLTPEQRLETVPSGLTRYRDRAGWALSALARAGAVTRPKRGTYVINDFGRRLVEEFPNGFTEKDLLKRVPGGGPGGTAPGGVTPDPAPIDVLNPREQIAAGVERLRAGVAADLLHASEALRG